MQDRSTGLWWTGRGMGLTGSALGSIRHGRVPPKSETILAAVVRFSRGVGILRAPIQGIVTTNPLYLIVLTAAYK